VFANLLLLLLLPLFGCELRAGGVPEVTITPEVGAPAKVVIFNVYVGKVSRGLRTDTALPAPEHS
jgi:hypothetical protein